MHFAVATRPSCGILLSPCYDPEQDAKAVSWYSRMEVVVDTFEPSQDPAPVEDSAGTFADRLDEAAAGNSPQPTGDQSADPQGFSGHPAWKPFEEALGPIHYHTIEPHLRSMNQAFESKIAQTNKLLEPWKGFADEGIDPDELRFSRQLAQEINTDPLGFYGKLETYLRQTGQLEAAAQVAQVADDIENGQQGDEDPVVSELRQQIAQLQEAQQQAQQGQLQWIQEQQFQQSVSGELTKLENEVQALKTAGADDRTIKAVLDRAELAHLRGGKPQSLKEHYDAIVQDQQFIRSQPQAVDRAPRLPGVTGGAPSQGGADLANVSRSQSVDILASLIEQNRGR